MCLARLDDTVVSSQPTSKVIQELKSAGFETLRRRRPHTIWAHRSGVHVVVADGHRFTSPGVYRVILRAIAESKEAR